MTDVLRQISVTCFFTSYLVVLVLESLRLLGRIPGRGLAVLVMSGIGLFTHVTYLTIRATSSELGVDMGRMATWTDWSLLVALGMAIAFVFYYLRRPDTVVGFFFMPVVLGLIGLGVAVRDLPAFDRSEATQVWQNVHAISMMIGSATVLLGFLAGAMYLVQSWRIKKKRAGSAWRLPTLESLQSVNRRCLVASTIAVGIGFLSGVFMNWNRLGEIPWTNRGIVFSAVWFVWLAAASMIELVYMPASRGRKVAYLMVASFGFLVLAIAAVLSSDHGQVSPASNAPISALSGESS
ncbi:MAG: cytochrome C assembly protein [Planctomycetota bacterium]